MSRWCFPIFYVFNASFMQIGHLYLKLIKFRVLCCQIDLFHIRSQPLFHAENLEKSLFLVFEIEFDIMIESLKPLSVQQFVKSFHLGIQCDMITCLSFMQPCEKSLFDLWYWTATCLPACVL